jgi:hypothetical protein
MQAFTYPYGCDSVGTNVFEDYIMSLVSCPRQSLAFAIAFACAAGNSNAITITVDDGGDALSPAGCTFRGALTAVNNAAFGVSDPCTTAGTFGSSDTITFAPALASSTITLQQGQLAFTNGVTINGSGQTLDGNAASRILNVSQAVSASNITLSNGSLNGKGAAAYVNGAAASLTLSNAHVTGNTGTLGTLYVHAGAALTLVNSFVTSNSSSGDGAGIDIVGGGALTLINSTIAGNTANCSLNYCAGAISSALGIPVVRLYGSTISGNMVSGATTYVAGAIYAYNSVVSLVNTTVAGNTATGMDGVAGAIQENHSAAAGPLAGLTLTNVTITGNSANTSNAAAGYVTGGVLEAFFSGGKVTAANTIDSGNTGTGGVAPTADFATNPANNPTIRFTNCLLGVALNVSPYNLPANANQFSDTPGLGPLQNNGGKTQTMAVLAGSLAIDNGSNALAVDAGSNPLQTDQTGYVRIYNGTVDIGAFEYPGDHIFGDGFE